MEEKLLKEVMHLEKQPYGSAEASVLRNYLDVCLELPWTKTSKERASVAAARKILDADHFGLEKVKERILEFAGREAAGTRSEGADHLPGGPSRRGQDLHRHVHGQGHESEAGPHLPGRRPRRGRDPGPPEDLRRGYARPHHQRRAARRAASNPLILLDEIDKLGSDMRGDPASALLEVLDAEQNATFRDHFVELPFDLSDVLFITTANTT